MRDKIKVIVISDTHHDILDAMEVFEAERPDYVLHLGDLADDCLELENIYEHLDIIGVSGNCDWAGAEAITERMLDIGGVKIFMCHGHTYSVKSGYDRLIAAARAKGADIALFGHTHRSMYDHLGDIAIMNPGTTDTYGLIEIEGGAFRGSIKAVDELK